MDEDEVIGEMDVYLAKGLQDNIFLLQYPTTSTKRTYTADQRIVARVKPEHKKLEMEVLIDVSSPNYDQSKGEQIALNVDGGITGEGMTYENSVMDTQVLSSKCVPQMGKRYVAGIIYDGQLHLTPVSEVMQLQPSFKYMDRAEMRAMQAAKLKAQAESGNSSQDEAEDAKAVTVRFKGVESEAARTARERSYAAYEKRLQQEKWIAATVHSKNDSYTDRERKRLVCGKVFNTNMDGGTGLMFTEMCLPASDYLKTLVPKYIVSDVDSNTIPDNVLSLAKLGSLSLGEQLKCLMRSANIVHFSHLLTLIPGASDANSVVRSLQSFAVLVQGCWIVKSEILYPANTVSSITGVPAETMCRVRDYILCLFTKYDYIVRRDVAKKLLIPGEEIKAIFDPIARMKNGHGWHLRLPNDTRFKNKFPEVYERQAMVWAARFKQLTKQLQIETTPDGHHNKINTSGKRKTSVSKSHPSNTAKNPTSSRATSSTSEINTKLVNGESGHTANITKDLKPVTQASMKNNFENNGFVSMEIPEPMEYDLSEKTPSFTQLLQEDVDPSCHPTVPFVCPEVVGIETAQNATPHHNFNMEGINSTVALVTDKMYQQTGRVMNENNSANSIVNTSNLSNSMH
ncbi:unnamed protein product [Clavelina lepadiformis]|uniref:DNA-directed RNA polymerase III subunit RPC5 n=1 Tax=Clavelina lepadiformis TaxID=159417 RepID=A0ABP0G663_CLALP